MNKLPAARKKKPRIVRAPARTPARTATLNAGAQRAQGAMILAAGLIRLRRLAAALQLAGLASLPVLPAMMTADVLLCGNAWAAPRVPATALPNTTKTNGPTSVYGTANGYTVSGSTLAPILTITQTAATSIVNWSSFDIGANATVNIKQPTAGSVLLNNVTGGAFLNQTTIEGTLTSNGRVYIYNPNGILFGSGANINVGALIASTLAFDQSRVTGGLLVPGTAPALGADPNFAGMPGSVIVNSGASLTAANGGLIMLAAPTVINGGAISAPDGQVVLAAGSKVYLAAPDTAVTGTNLRGLVVEVSNDYAPTNGAASTGASLAENNGSISVGRGNATMIGYAVNQNGLVSATTSVSLNGSIYLYARDEAITTGGVSTTYEASRTGALTLGAGSVTEVLPTLNDASTVPVTSAFNPSVVNLDGANIALQQNAKILAPNGNVTITAGQAAYANLGSGVQYVNPASDLYRVDLAPGSVIDVSGTTGTQLPMSSNVISVNLRGTELANNPVLENSSLYGSSVNIDIRNGASAAGTAANISGWLNLVDQNVGQLTAAGGTVNINADSAIIARPGSTINVNGGAVDYQAGYLNTSYLQLNGALAPIASATSGTLYTGVVNLPNSPGNYEPGYTEGGNAGAIRFAAPILALQGSLSGETTPGALQRNVAAANYPLGGRLEIGQNISDNAGNAADSFGFTGDISLGGASTAATEPAVNAPFDFTDTADKSFLTLTLNPTALANAGFSRLVAYTTGNISVDAPVTLAPGGMLTLSASAVDGSAHADGSTWLGGNVTFNANATVSIPGGTLSATANANGTASGTLQVADGVTFDLAGRWINDLATSTPAPALDINGNPTQPIDTKGGTLKLTANQLDIGNNVTADVSGGAWDNAKGHVTWGSAGSITLQAPGGPQAPAPQTGNPADPALELGSDLTLKAYGYSTGGTLNITARNVSIGAAPDSQDPADLWLQPAFFQSGGFSNYNIAANLNFTVQANTTVAPQALNWQPNTNYSAAPSGAMSTVAAPILLNLAGTGRTRAPTNATFSALQIERDGDGFLTIDSGAQLLMDPGASLSLSATRQLTELGTLDAPGGNISLTQTGGVTYSSPADALANASAPSIWFGPKANVSAAGTTQLMTVAADNVASGNILGGGSIQITSAGYVVAQTGATFNVNGVNAGAVRLSSAAGIAPLQDVAAPGGSIDIQAGGGLLFAGTLEGSGGSLAVTLDSGNTLTVSANAPSGGVVPSKLTFSTPSTDTTPLELQPIVDSAGFLTGTTPSAGRAGGQGWLPASTFSSGGFSQLDFTSQSALAFGLGSTPLTLSASNSLILNAPVLLADANPALTAATVSKSNTLTLSAPYIELGSSDPSSQILAGVNSNTLNAALAVTGNATLVANASTIDLIGNSVWQGFGTGKLNASADVRLIGMPPYTNDNGYQWGSLSMIGNLTLTDAQTYPTTLSDFTFIVAPGNVLNPPAGTAPGIDPTSGTLTFASNGTPPLQVMSAGGTLTGIAQNIVQEGVVTAPFGAITFGNLDSTTLSTITGTTLPTTVSLDYKPGSTTSVAGAGLVPFGTVYSGGVSTSSIWEYTLSDNTQVEIVANPVAGTGTLQRALPAKSITSYAQTISQDSGSVLNVAGGGSLFAYEFTAGAGGSYDALNSAYGTYAIDPSFHGNVAPVDSTYGSDGLPPGASVYLSGIPGLLAAGVYTLLPGHYALLPGAFSVSLASNNMQPGGNTVLPDGTMLVSGYVEQVGISTAGTPSAGFIVTPNSVINPAANANSPRTSTYTITNIDTTYPFANAIAAAGVSAPEMPADGGRIAFDGGGTGSPNNVPISLNGAMQLGAATGGRNGELDISAQQIDIVSSASQNTGNAVQLIAGDLTALGADSLVIGALRTPINGGMQLSNLAAGVTLGNDAQHVLSSPEIVLAASGAITINAGADLQAQGTLGRSASNLTMAADSNGNANGALLAVSSGGPMTVTRAGVVSASGTINIGADATVGAAGSAYLDAPGGATLNGQIIIASGGALEIGAPLIEMGSALPASDAASALQLDTAELGILGGLSQLSFNSYGSAIGLYGTVALGNQAMQKLSFTSAGFQGDGGTVNFSANTVSFTGAAAATAATTPAAPAAGSFTVTANNIDIGSNAFPIHGYANSALNAAAQVMATGTGSAGDLFSADGNLTLTAGVIDTAAAADANFAAGGTLTLNQAPATTNTPELGLGGSLTFQGANIVSNAAIMAPAGEVQLWVGAGANNGIDITGGKITTAPTGMAFGSTVAYAPGGSITLTGGNVTVGSNATLDVSAVGAAAGILSITAGSGGLSLDGVMTGGAQAGIDGVLPTQGQFVLNAYQTPTAIDGFGALNAQLNAGGFTQSRQFTYQQGNVTLGTGDTVTAQQVMIATDNGNIAIGGNALIDARGAEGGSIQLYASQPSAAGSLGSVTLSGAAQLLANSTAAATSVTGAGSLGKGGSVTIGTGSADGLPATSTSMGAGGTINLLGGTIDVSGVTPVAQSGIAVSTTAQNGTVTLRAPRVGSGSGGGSDVAISSLATPILGSGATTIEAYKVYTGSTISDLPDSATNLNASTNGAMYTDASSFIGNAPAILSRLGGANVTANLSLSPGIEVRSSGNLTVSVDEFDPLPANRGWNLDTWRFGSDSAPIMLTLRAAGNLDILGSISDGFVQSTNPHLSMPDWQLDTGSSASLRLTGGADLAGANPLATNNTGAGDVVFGFADRTLISAAPVTATDAPVALVRTGTGSIDVAAAGNITLQMAPFFTVQGTGDSAVTPTNPGAPAVYNITDGTNYSISLFGATVYTAGQATSPNGASYTTLLNGAATSLSGTSFTAPLNALNPQYGGTGNTAAQFSNDGGAISMTAGGNINGPLTTTPLADWYYLNNTGSIAVQAAPATKATQGNDASPATAYVPAIPGTPVMLSATMLELVDDWLFRQGRTEVDAGNTVFTTIPGTATTPALTLNTAWWSRFDYFDQGVATFGGGNISLIAGGNISNLSASVATNAYVPGSSTTTPTTTSYTPGASPTVPVQQGGGDLLVRAGGNINGGAFYVQQGTATLHAGGSIEAGNDMPVGAGPIVPGLSTLANAVDTALSAGAETSITASAVTTGLISAGQKTVIDTAYANGGNTAANEAAGQAAVNTLDTTGLTNLIKNIDGATSLSAETSLTANAVAAGLISVGQKTWIDEYCAPLLVLAGAVGSAASATAEKTLTANAANASNVNIPITGEQEAAIDLAYATAYAAASKTAGGGTAGAAAGEAAAIAAVQAILPSAVATGFSSAAGVTAVEIAAVQATIPTAAAGVQFAPPAAATAPLNPILAVGNAQFNVSANRNLAIEASYNPMMTEQSNQNVNIVPSYGAFYPTGQNWDSTGQSNLTPTFAQFSNFSTYTAASAVNLTAIGGNLRLSNNVASLAVAGAGNAPYPNPSDRGNLAAFAAFNNVGDYLDTDGSTLFYGNLYAFAPPTFSAAALSANLSSANGFTMMPAASGQLDLLAAGSISLVNSASGVNGANGILMLDNDPTAMSNATAPRLYTVTDQDILSGTVSVDAPLISFHTLGGLHTGDTQPVEVVALTGDINGDGSQQSTLTLPKAAQIQAGQNIVNLGFSIQQNATTDVTSIVAGGNFIDTEQNQAGLVANIVTGPGRIDITAGGNVDFGNGQGLVTRGNLDNPYLPSGGAAVNIVAGIGETQADYATFVNYAASQYGTAANKSDSPATLAGWLASDDKPDLNTLFFSMLVTDGGATNLAPFDKTIASLYPVTAGKQAADLGDIDVYNSQVKTEQGGSVNLFAPTGSVYAGLTTGVSGAAASKQGIFTISGGAIDALVESDFLVNQGRVFTVGGGDITLVSQYGNIDAGRGAKTATSAPPPVLTVSPNGSVSVDFSGSISGSGIATLITQPDQPPANVYAIAPRGVFNASDAGVRSSGSVDIIAPIVLNASNITAAGSITGAPVTVAPPPMAIAAPASTVAASSDAGKALSNANSADASASLAVELLGYGPDGAPPAATPATDDAPEGVNDEELRKKKKTPKDKQQSST